MTARRTYWHLEPLKRKPTDYEVATSKLLYYPDRGFEVDVPVAEWYRRYQKDSPFQVLDPERFQDPRETTYTKYTGLQKDKEIYVDGLLQSMEETGYDRELPASWIEVLSRVLAPLRYPVHGLQMIASYVGQMAPGGRLVVALLFQTGDEIRRVQRLAYRMRLLQATHPGFGERSREAWQRDPLWQPLRELVEKLLVTYDWGEAFAALNLVLKPVFDEFFMVQFGESAGRSGDPLLGKIFLSLNDDCRWHREWSRAFVRTALEERPENQAVLRGWIRKWQPSALQAIAAFGGLEPLFSRSSFSAFMNRLHLFLRDYWASTGLAISPE